MEKSEKKHSIKNMSPHKLCCLFIYSVFVSLVSSSFQARFGTVKFKNTDLNINDAYIHRIRFKTLQQMLAGLRGAPKAFSSLKGSISIKMCVFVN